MMNCLNLCLKKAPVEPDERQKRIDAYDKWAADFSEWRLKMRDLHSGFLYDIYRLGEHINLSVVPSKDDILKQCRGDTIIWSPVRNIVLYDCWLDTCSWSTLHSAHLEGQAYLNATRKGYKKFINACNIINRIYYEDGKNYSANGLHYIQMRKSGVVVESIGKTDKFM